MRHMNAARFFAEFVVIVVGVLVALGVDEWRQSRDDRAAEGQYVERLIVDLVSDSILNVRMIEVGAQKSEDLSATIEALSNPEQVRRHPSLVWPNMNLTYARPELQTTTFDELKSSGGLSLIHDEHLRFRVGDHYRSVLHHDERLDDRRTRLASVVAGLYPGMSWGVGTALDLSPVEIDSTFYASPLVEYRLQELLGPEYQSLLNQERLYARSIEGISAQILNLTNTLLSELREYQTSLR